MMQKIDSKTWKAFDVGGKNGLFEIEFCKCDHVGALLDGDIPYVGAAKVNNGVQKYVADETPSLITEGNCIVFICNGQGSAGYALYQKDRFIGTKDVKVGRNPHLNELNGLFIVASLDKNREIYGYGFAEKRSLDAMKREKVVLPSTDSGEPDWAYMEAYMQSVLKGEHQYAEIVASISNPTTIIDLTRWKRFHLYDKGLFEIDMGTKLDKIKMTEFNPEVNFVGRANANNGITGRVDIIEGLNPYEAGSMTLSLGGEYLGSCFIQPDRFYTSQNVVVLIPQWNMPYEVKLFLSSVIFKESRTYYKAFVDELNRHVKTDFSFVLPAKDDNQPDWEYMEKYMRKVLDDVRPSAEEIARLA